MSIKNLILIFIILVFIIPPILNFIIIAIITKLGSLPLIPLSLYSHSPLETLHHHHLIQKYFTRFFHLKLRKIPY